MKFLCEVNCKSCDKVGDLYQFDDDKIVYPKKWVYHIDNYICEECIRKQ